MGYSVDRLRPEAIVSSAARIVQCGYYPRTVLIKPDNTCGMPFQLIFSYTAFLLRPARSSGYSSPI
jgi:hypothetical protein